MNDNLELLDLLGEIMASERYTTTLICSVGDDIVQQVRQSEPDLLMVDLRHGEEGMRGWEIVRELRGSERCPRVPVLLSSADYGALSQLKPDLDAAGRIETLKVPFGVDELIHSIDRLIGEQEAPGCS